MGIIRGWRDDDEDDDDLHLHDHHHNHRHRRHDNLKIFTPLQSFLHDMQLSSFI